MSTEIRAELESRILKIEAALADATDLLTNRVMASAGEWKGLKKGLGQYDETMWQMLERIRGI